MNIYVLDDTSTVSGIIEKFESVIWNMQFFSGNDFQLIVPLSSGSLDLLAPDKYLVRDVDVGSGEYHNVMMIEDRKITFDAEKGWMLTVSGGGLKKIVGRRVIWDQMNFEQENVEDAIRQVITDNIISPDDSDREIDDFILDTAVGFTDTFDAQVFSENIAEWLETVCSTYGYGWDVYIKNGKYVFTLIEGSDRSYGQNVLPPVVFSPEFDNLASAEYTYKKSEYHNVGLIGGEGEGATKVVTSVGSSSGLERYEVYIDGSDVSSNGEIITMETYVSMLQTYGSEQLTEASFTEEFSGEIIQNGMYVYGVDFFLGDKVEVDMGYVSAGSRIIEMIYSEDSNGSSLIPTFSDWEV